MDGFTVDMFNPAEASTPLEEVVEQAQEDDTAAQAAPGAADEANPAPRKWKGFNVLRERANIQDRLLERLLAQVIPPEDGPSGRLPDDDGAGAGDDGGAGAPAAERPNFNLPTMTYNFRRFNARIGVVFKFQARVGRLLAWRRASHTLSLLAVYTFVCLDPYLLSVLPPALVLLGVLLPSFVARHPGDAAELAYSPRGPPRAPARDVRPVKELSRDFFRNMRDLQNGMDDFSRAHDRVVSALVPRTNFSDERLSSALVVVLAAACAVMSIAAHLLPWRLVFLAAGWAAVASGHPAVARALRRAHRAHVAPQGARAGEAARGWVARDILLDSAPEAREVEIFELQRRSSPVAGEWEPWLFSPSPYDPLSQARIAGERPAGTRFFEDVLAPEGWEWSEKKWALDLWSREWVEDRIITGVEVETEGERWVYDMYDERAGRTGVADPPGPAPAPGPWRPGLSWEEGEEGEGRRGEWRRRRWVRMVRRKTAAGS